MAGGVANTRVNRGSLQHGQGGSISDPMSPRTEATITIVNVGIDSIRLGTKTQGEIPSPLKNPPWANMLLDRYEE